MEYKILNISSNTNHFFKECFDKNGSPKNIEAINWQFLDNPVGKQFVDIARDEEKNNTAAIYAISPVWFKLKNKVKLGSQSLDTITDVKYRGQGLFIKLANSVYEKATEENVQFVYGFPNGNSIHGFSKRLDWTVLDPVPFLIKPLKSRYFTNKIKILSWLPNINISKNYKINNTEYLIDKKLEFPEEVDRVWDLFSQEINVAVQRDRKYLEWRYIDKPFEDYIIQHIYKESEYIGFIVYCVKSKHGGKIGYIMEMIYDPKYSDAAILLMKVALNDIITQNADCVLAWCFTHSVNYHVYKDVGFYTFPEKLKPIELHFGVRSFDPKMNELVSNRENWYLSYSDSDTV